MPSGTISSGLVKMKKTAVILSILALVISSYAQTENKENCRKLVDYEGKRGYLDCDNNMVIPPIYEITPTYGGRGHFHEGFAAVYRNEKWGFIDINGKEIVPPKYDYVWNFQNGFALVESGEKYGYIDTTGNDIVSLKYDRPIWALRGFHEGYAEAGLNGKWGFVDTQGNEVIPLKYDHVWYFSDGIAQVELNGRKFYIDTQGNEIGLNDKPKEIIFEQSDNFNFQVGISQNGLETIITKNSVTLQKKEFAIVLHLPQPMGISISASFNDRTYKPATKQKPLGELPAFQSTGMARQKCPDLFYRQ